ARTKSTPRAACWRMARPPLTTPLRSCSTSRLRMRPPEFWKADAGGRDAALTLRAVLTPISWAYAWEVARRMRSTLPRHALVPVICVGNFTVGGGGKTPVTRAIRAKLGAGAHTLSRGYGGRVEGPLRVTPDMDARE